MTILNVRPSQALQKTAKIALPLMAGIVLTGLTIQKSFADPPNDKLNVVFIMADDLGWMDVGYMNGGFVETPHIDAFASRGMVFQNAYAANPLCSPSRASMLTGLYPARIGITAPHCHYADIILAKGLDSANSVNKKWIQAESVTRLDTTYLTLANVLKEAGFATAHFGKWHLGNEPYGPLQHGFDTTFPRWLWAPGPGPYLAPWRWGVNGTEDNGEEGEHIENRTVDRAIEFIKENKDRPFFLNYWAWSVHGPIQAKDDLIPKYLNKLDTANLHRNPIFGGMVETLDDNVGRILKALDQHGLTDRTVIVFFSDNGGVHYPIGQDYNNLPVTINAPLRGGKATIYEGGTKVPCIVHWPAITQGGHYSDEIVSSIDWFPTLLEMAGIPVNPQWALDGRSFADAVRGKPLPIQPLFCHYPHGNPDEIEEKIGPGHKPSSYVRLDRWKLIRFYCDNDDQTDRHELYDLVNDPGEQHDLVNKHQKTVTALSVLLDDFLAQTEAVIPVKNPNYSQNKIE